MPQLRTNVEFWKEIQENDYFENHPCYRGLRDFDQSTCALIEAFTPLSPAMRVAVIGCGYGRDTRHIAPRVAHVFGIDVSPKILEKAKKYLGENGIKNFTPVLAEHYKTAIPSGLDLVFSIVVMQHLTRDLVRDYFVNLGSKLNPGGSIIVQFLEDVFEGAQVDNDAELKLYEPSVSWTVRQLVDLTRESNLEFREVRTIQVSPTAVWHWAHFGKRAAV